MAKERTGTGFSLKDQLFNRERVEYLAGQFHSADSEFDRDGFVRDTMRSLTSLELKQRVVLIAEMLEKHLATDYRAAVKHLVASLPPPLDPTKTDDDFGDFIFAPLGEFVVRNGLAKRHLSLSLKTLKAITQRFSMEDAIRAFINEHPEPTLATLTKWSTDKNYHVRRLVSEGTRPILPWSKRLTIDVATPLPLLDTLHADRARYVTRSVANHLNDISKSQPELVLQRLERWAGQGGQDPRELRWMSRHALRTLVKQGHVDALRFLGFHASPKIEIDRFELQSTKVASGQAIDFAFSVKADRDESLLVDFVIDFVKANGKLAPKVHKLKQVQLRKGEATTIRKRHVLRANATTYRLYPGTHHLTLQINGKPFGTQTFEVP